MTANQINRQNDARNAANARRVIAMMSTESLTEMAAYTGTNAKHRAEAAVARDTLRMRRANA